MLKRIESGISAKSLGADYLPLVKNYATPFGITGVVFEKHDGSVKIIAEGEEENLEIFVDKLEKDSFMHPVENFYVKWEDPTGEFKEFSVNYKG